MNRSIVMAALSILAAACGGGGGGGASSGSGTITPTGSLGGVTFTSVADAYSASYVGPADCSAPSGKQISILLVVITDVGGFCTASHNGTTAPATSDVLTLLIGSSGTTAQAAVGAGTYNVSSNTDASVVSAGAILGTLANGCDTAHALGSSGSVTLTSVTSNAVKGSYNLTLVDTSFNAAGTISGTFDTSNCAASSTTCTATSGSTNACH